MKLISLREFVLNQISRIENCETTHIESHHQIVDYAKFLSRPLELGMFLPCDLDGNVLEEPNHLDYKFEKYPNELHFISESHKQRYSDTYDAYNEAKSRVLFEGFEISMPNKATHRITNGVLQIDFFEDDNINSRDGIYDNWAIIEIIEDMLKYSVTLTETARKEIGL